MYQDDLTRVEEGMTHNKITVNTKKSFSLYTGNTDGDLILNSEKIQKPSLGVIIDKTLSVEL